MGTVGIAIIAKNEEKQLPSLLASIDGAFDRAVLLDTGSTDSTIDIFGKWAKMQTGMTFSVAQWEWKDDFSDARNAADRLLLYGSAPADGYRPEVPLVDWRCWADCDDVLVGASNLRAVANSVTDEVTALFAGYNYIQDENGQCVTYLRRERLVRATYTEPWSGRVHEATPITTGVVTNIPPDTVEWVHKKVHRAEESNNRNVKILEKWNKDEPQVPRIVGYLGVENLVRGKIDEALDYFLEYIELPVGWSEEYAQVCRKVAQCHLMKEKPDLAIDAAQLGMKESPKWIDNYLTMAEAYYFKGEHTKSLEWARIAESFGSPDTLLIVNPTDYTFLPKKLIALNLAEMNQVEEAVEIGMHALQMQPNDPYLGSKMQEWRSTQKREHTANTYAMCAEQLIGHDEQLKALTLLEDCVPVFATDHPRVCALRSMLKTRLAWVEDADDFAEHYESGGSKPEDFIADETIEPLCEYLPRTNFLLEGLQEQMNAA